MKRILIVAVLAAVQLGLVGAAVAPQLSARLTGDVLLMPVALLDPIDPFRGAYVRLDYPGLRHDDAPVFTGGGLGGLDDGKEGDVFITLAEQGEVWVATDWSRERPEDSPYLACSDLGWDLRCGIESFFLPQDEAASMETLLRDGAVAELRVDSRGNAAVVDIRAP